MAHIAHTPPGTRSRILDAADWIVCRVCAMLKALIAHQRRRRDMRTIARLDAHILRDVGLEDYAQPPRNPYTVGWGSMR